MHRTYGPQRHPNAMYPIAYLHPSPELWGVRDPTDLMPRLPSFAKQAWFEAYCYSDRPKPAPGLLRRALHGIWSGAAVLGRAIGRHPLRGTLARPQNTVLPPTPTPAPIWGIPQRCPSEKIC
jgi:hypothetical protein